MCTHCLGSYGDPMPAVYVLRSKNQKNATLFRLYTPTFFMIYSLQTYSFCYSSRLFMFLYMFCRTTQTKEQKRKRNNHMKSNVTIVGVNYTTYMSVFRSYINKLSQWTVLFLFLMVTRISKAAFVWKDRKPIHRCAYDEWLPKTS